MKKFFDKYLLILWIVIVGVYNAVLFLLFNEFNKEAFGSSVFWVLYGIQMFAFVAWLVTGMFEKNTKDGGLNPVKTFVVPYVVIMFVMTTIMFLFVLKLNIILVIIPFIIITGVILVPVIFALKNREMIAQNPQRTPELFKVEGLKRYFEEFAVTTDASLKDLLLDLAQECELLETVDNKEVLKIDKRLFEYAQLIKQNACRGETLNIGNNVERFKKVLKERAQLLEDK